MTGVEVSALLHVHDPGTDVDLLYRAYKEALDRTGKRWEMLFVLDGVEEPVLGKLNSLRERDRRVRILALHSSFGESVAFAAGAETAAGQYLLTLPSYLQIEPMEILTLVEELEKGAHLVTPWRHPRVDPWINRLQSILFNWIIRLIIHSDFHDLNCGFRGIRKEVLEEITLYGDLFRFLPVIAARQGFRVKEVRVRHKMELGKRGFFGLGVYIRRFLDILAVLFLSRFTQKPLRFFGMMGFILILTGLGLAAEPVIRKLLGEGSLQDRPLFLVGVAVFTFGVQLIGFGLVGEIIIFTQSKHMREYKVDQILEARDPAEAEEKLPHAPEVEVMDRVEPAGLLVRGLSAGEDARWDRYVRAHPQGTPFHLSGWRRVVWETFGHDPLYLLAEEGTLIRGVLPVFRATCFAEGFRRMKVHISVPYGVYGGILADDGEVERALLKDACRRAEAEGVGYLELRDKEDRGYDLPGSDLYVGFIGDLPEKPEDCLGRIPRKARAEVRKGRDRNGLVFREGLEMKEFHRLFAVNKRHLGTPPLPRRYFEALQEEFGESVYLHAVSTPEGRVAGAVLSFAWRDTLMPYYSGSVKELDRLGVNNFMYWALMRWGVEKGFRKFDFGRSRKDSGSYHFKRHMGFEPFPLRYQFYLVRSRSVPAFHPGNPETRKAQKIWSKMPMALAVPLGGILSKYLP